MFDEHCYCLTVLDVVFSLVVCRFVAFDSFVISNLCIYSRFGITYPKINVLIICKDDFE